MGDNRVPVLFLGRRDRLGEDETLLLLVAKLQPSLDPSLLCSVFHFALQRDMVDDIVSSPLAVLFYFVE